MAVGLVTERPQYVESQDRPTERGIWFARTVEATIRENKRKGDEQYRLARHGQILGLIIIIIILI